jgi:hypothetical protein
MALSDCLYVGYLMKSKPEIWISIESLLILSDLILTTLKRVKKLQVKKTCLRARYACLQPQLIQPPTLDVRDKIGLSVLIFASGLHLKLLGNYN